MRNGSSLPLKLLPLVIILIGFGLRVYRLDSQALRGDEAATILYAALPISDLWELSRLTDPHPPLYYLLLHPWQILFGEGAWMMRFAGVAASTLAIAALYALSRHTLRLSLAALIAAGLLAVSPLQIWQAQDVRSYPFFTLFGLLSTWCLWLALTRRAKLPWLLYIFFTIVSLYTHYYSIFLIAFQGLFVLLNARRFWPKRYGWLGSQLTIGLLIIPGLQLAYNFLGQAAGGIETVPFLEILRRAATALLTGFTVGYTLSLWVTLLLIPLAILGLIYLLRQNFTIGTFWTLYFATPVAGVIALSIGRPFFKERFLIQAQPAFVLLLAVGLFILIRGRGITNFTTKNLLRFSALLLLLFLLFTNLTALTNYHTDPAYIKAPPWYLYHDYVDDHAQAGDVMLTNFPEAAVSYYSPNDLPFYVVPDELHLPVARQLEATRQIAAAYQRIWFLPLLQPGFDEKGEVLNWLDRHGDRLEQVFFPVYNINLYLSPTAIEQLMIPQPTPFSHNIRLRGYQIFDEQGQSRLQLDQSNQPLLTIKPDREFTLSLYWQAETTVAEPYTVFTHLIAADGFNRTGHDNQPVWGSYPTTAWSAGEAITDKYTLTIPPGTPPGDHRLHIGWYHSESGERVFVVDEAGQVVDDKVVLDVVVRVE